MVSWADTNAPRTGLTFISQDVELMIWFSAGLAPVAQSTAAQAVGCARMGWECVVRGYGRAELDVLGSDQFGLHTF